MPETSEHASAATDTPTVLDQSTQSHIDSLYRAAVGPIRANRYLPVLLRFETHGRASPSWNWAACLCTFNWMLFRGLWLEALAYLCVVGAAAAALAFAIASSEPPMVASLRWSLWAALATMVLLVPGFFGDAWLYRAYGRRLEAALTRTARLQDACALLARQAATRTRLQAIVTLNLALAIALAFVLWPRERMVEPGASAGTSAPPPAATASALAHVPAWAPAPASGPTPAVTDARTTDAATSASASAASAGRMTGTPMPASPSTRSHTNETAQPAAGASFLINVGVFAQPGNAQRALDKLSGAGLPVLQTRHQTNAGPRTRIRVGPFASRAQADAAAQQIRALQLDAVVVAP